MGSRYSVPELADTRHKTEIIAVVVLPHSATVLAAEYVAELAVELAAELVAGLKIVVVAVDSAGQETAAVVSDLAVDGIAGTDLSFAADVLVVELGMLVVVVFETVAVVERDW